MGRNVQLGSGKVHHCDAPEGFVRPDCGGNRGTEGYRVVTAPVDCRNCLKIMSKNEAKGENTMSETQTPEQDTNLLTVEQIQANVERATSLAEAENVEGLKELEKETETLVSGLPSRGRVTLPGDEAPKTWAQIKKDLRGAFREAAQAAPKPEPKATKGEVKKVTQGQIVEKTWDQYEGVPALVTDGAKMLADGVKLHLKSSHVAKDVAGVVFEIWTRVPNKEGNPDILGASDAAKKASGEMLRLAGEGFERTYDNEQALKKLGRSVQDQRSDVRAEWLRSLDNDDEIGAARRELVAGVLGGKPDDVPVSEWVANAYGTSTIGQTEKRRLEYQAKQQAKELETAGGEAIVTPGGGEGEGEAEETSTPDERVTSVAKRLIKDIGMVTPDDFEQASDETKEAVRTQLEEAIKALRAMVSATL